MVMRANPSGGGREREILEHAVRAVISKEEDLVDEASEVGHDTPQFVHRVAGV